MAIQNRRGNFVDFDPYKMRPGEWAFPLDRGEGYYCISPGDVRRVATKEEIIEILETNQQAYDGLQQLLTELESETVATGILNDISDLIIKSNKNENDIIKINNRHIGTNLAIDTSQYYKSLNFTIGRSYLSPTGMTSLKEGDIVTLSAYISNITVAGGVALEVAFGDSNDAEIGVITGDFVTTDGLYSFTFTIPQGAVTGDIAARLQTTDSLDNGASIRNLKLELGSLVTPWKPSIYRLPTLEYELNTHLAESAKKHIKESGSNDDGQYIKYDDGTMFCVHAMGLDASAIKGVEEIWSFPKPFLLNTKPVCFAVLGANSAVSLPRVLVGVERNHTTNNISTKVYANVLTAEAAALRIHLFAMGVWK